MGAYKALGERQIIGTFWRQFAARENTLWAPSIANMYRSDQAVETFRWLGPLPAMQEWIGQRKKKQLKVHELTLKHAKYEVTVEFEIDDMDRDKTGQIGTRIGEMGATAAVLPQKRLSTIIASPGNSYDGIAFWGDHSAGPGTKINNVITDTTIADAGRPTSAETMRGVMDAIGVIQGALSPEDDPINDDAMEFAVMVPSLYQGPLAAALGDQFTSAGVSNSLQSLAKEKRLVIHQITNPRLVAPATGGTGVFYVFRVDTPTKPFIWQDEVSGEGGSPVKFDSLVEGSSDTFMSDKRLYGAKRKGVAAAGEHAMACRVTFS